MKNIAEALKALPNNGWDGDIDLAGNYPQEILALPIQQRLKLWYARGETGISSKMIARTFSETPFMNEFNKQKHSCHDDSPPLDVSDFRRCYLLLKLIPEWKKRMPEMVKYKYWEHVAKNWDKITELYEKGVIERFKQPEADEYKNKNLMDCYKLIKNRE